MNVYSIRSRARATTLHRAGGCACTRHHAELVLAPGTTPSWCASISAPMIRRFSATPKKSQKLRPVAPPARDRVYAGLPTEGTLRAAANLDAMPPLRVARLMLRE